MSGQLVGEVLAAASQLRARGLSDRGFRALLAIAEKAHTDTRQASVRWDHISDGLYGASKRTAERAVQDLKEAGLLTVIRPGFNNNHGRIRAPVYQLQQITDTDTQVTASMGGDTDTQVTGSVGGDTDKPATDTDKPGGRYRHPGDVLDVSLDGSLDGGAATVADTNGHATHPRSAKQRLNGPYGPRCQDHRNEPIPPRCGGCASAREVLEEDERQQLAHEAAARTAIRYAIDSCTQCDEFARRDDLSDCPLHANFRQLAAPG
jgi:hypothetical protein